MNVVEEVSLSTEEKPDFEISFKFKKFAYGLTIFCLCTICLFVYGIINFQVRFNIISIDFLIGIFLILILMIITWPTIPSYVKIVSGYIHFKEGNTIVTTVNRKVKIDGIRSVVYDWDHYKFVITTRDDIYKLSVDNVDSNVISSIIDGFKIIGFDVKRQYLFKGIDEDIVNEALQREQS